MKKNEKVHRGCARSTAPLVVARRRARMATYGGGEYGGGEYGRDVASDAPTPAAVYDEKIDAAPHVVAPVPTPVRIHRDEARATRRRNQNPGCFEQGGCCSAAPPVEVVGQDGSVHRVNLAFVGSPGCAGPAGRLANVGDRRSVPLALEEIGMTWNEYEEAFVTTLEAVGAKHFPDGCCASFLCGFAAVTFSLGCALPWICSRTSKVRYAYDADLRAWQKSVSETLGARYPGVSVKTQSMCFHTSDGRGNRQRHVVRWIAISLSVEDQARLAAEPHLFGTFSNCKCIGGVDETDLCMHL